MGSTGTRLVVTGANGGVGRNLLTHAAAVPGVQAVAVVRSERAASSLTGLRGIDVRVVAGDDAAGLAAVMHGASSVVHLAGILIESRDATYEQANVAATAAVVAACAVLPKLTVPGPEYFRHCTTGAELGAVTIPGSVATAPNEMT